MKKFIISVVSVITIIFFAIGINYGIWELKKPVPERELVDYGSFVKINEMDIHVWSAGVKKWGGKKTPLILIHAFAANSYSWRFNIEKLGSEFPVYAIDLPGFGYSEKPADFDYTLSGYANFITAFMDTMNIDKAVLVGNSMGGGVAIKTYLENPERVKKLILIDSMGYLGEEETYWVLELMEYPIIGEIVMSFNYRSMVKASLMTGPYYNNKFVTDRVIDVYFNVYKTKNGRHVPLWVNRGFEKAYPFEEGEMRGIKTPTLVIWGAEDNLIPVEHAQLFSEDIKNVKVEIIPEAGHMPHEEKSDIVNAVITDFVKN